MNLRGTGSGAVARNVLGAMLDIARGDHELDFWIPRDWACAERFRSDVSRVEEVRAGIMRRLYEENWRLRSRLAAWRPNCLFSLGDNSLPRAGVPHLLLVHQAYLAHAREELDFPLPPKFRAKLALLEMYFRATLPSVTMITVQTEHMKKGLAARWSFPEERIVVVPSAVEEVDIGDRPAEVGAYVAYVATPSAHKNFGVLADMMSIVRVKHPDVRCKLTVHPEDVPVMTSRADHLGVREAFDFLGPIPLLDARKLIAGATAVVIPSKLESFGLPYFEAMSLGVPIVAADRSCAREACGDAARYADADSGEEFADRVLSLIGDAAARDELKALGAARFRRIKQDWREVAAQYLEVLQRIAH